MIKNLIRNLIEQNNTYRATFCSYKKFHNPGVTYVNLLRRDELTAKLYFFDPTKLTFVDSRCPAGEAGIIVNPHSHMYNFDTYVITGAIQNIVYERCDQGEPWYETRYRSPLSGNKKVAYEGVTLLSGHPQKFLTRGCSYSFSHTGIHSLWVHPGIPTILFLLQYRDQPKEHTSLFLPSPEPPDLSGLYEVMSEDEIREYQQIALEHLR